MTKAGSLSGDFQQALDHISTAPDIPTKKKYPALKPSLDTIHVHAEKRGLPDEVLKTFIDAITRPNSFDQTSQKALITSLYPAGRVPTEIVSIVVGSLGYGASKASVPTQQLLLQWVIMVSDYLEAPSSLSQFYSVLFNLLDMTNLRADTCRLLAKITRRKHVRPFRIQMLRDLSTAVGPEPALLRLMHVYDRYAPGVLDLRSSKRFGNFPHLDPEWGLRLDRIQSRNRLQTTSADVENYVERLERVDLSDLKSVDLRDRTVQLNLALGPLETSRREIDDCLSAILEPRLEKSFNGHDIGKSHSEALESVLIYTRYTKVGVRMAVAS